MPSARASAPGQRAKSAGAKRGAGAKAAAGGVTAAGAAAKAAGAEPSAQQKLTAAQNLRTEAQRRLEGINEEVHATAVKLGQVKQTESFDAATGVGMNLQGQSIAQLEVTVIAARDLPKMDMFSGKADPYVILNLVPKTACPDPTERRTETKWKNLNPSWNQDFLFSPITTREATLKLTLMDAEKFGDDDFMAQVEVPLSELLSQDYEELWYPLVDPENLSSAEQVKGSLRVRTKFTYSNIQPLEARLTELHQAKANTEQELQSLEEQIAKLQSKKGLFKSRQAAQKAYQPVAAAPAPAPRAVRDRAGSSAADRLADWLICDEDEAEVYVDPTASAEVQRQQRQQAQAARQPAEEMEDTDICVIS